MSPFLHYAGLAALFSILLDLALAPITGDYRPAAYLAVAVLVGFMGENVEDDDDDITPA